MRGTVIEAFVDPVRQVYMAEGIEVEVPENRVAEFARWMRFKGQEAETPVEKTPKKKTAAKKTKK